MLTLLLVCAFSPRVHSIPRGPLIFARNDVKRVARNKKPTKKHPFGCLNIKSPPKRREFDGFLGFFAGSENPSVRGVHEFSGSVKTPKRRELSPFCLVVLVLKKIQHLPAPADKQRIAVKQRLVRGEVDDDVVVALDRKNVDVVFFADIKRHKRASRPT